MTFKEVFGTTASFSSSGPNGRPSDPDIAIPTLTILYHPNLERIGERIQLAELSSGREVQISREKPLFTKPGEAYGESLGDPYLSRAPFHINLVRRGTLQLSLGSSRINLQVGGRKMVEPINLNIAELAEGVVLMLSERVILLLHTITPVSDHEEETLGLIGDSSGITRVRSEIRRIADLEVPVLVRGETGTGKELVASAIHSQGPRRSESFVGVNMGAIQPSIAGAELFGNIKGAFTGAVQDRKGYFRTAHQGSLFLDEVGEAPPEVQVMLLRVLETGTISPVGSQQSISVDVRVIAATDADLEDQVQTGNFRGPLLHRLSSYEIWLPPLRQRRDDIGRLLVHFLRSELKRVGEEHRMQLADPMAQPWLPAELVSSLVCFNWPGNVRQLKNVVRQLVIDNRGRNKLHVGVKLKRVLEQATSNLSAPWNQLEQPPETIFPTIVPEIPRPKRRKPADISSEELLEALREKRWELQASAEFLGISRPSLYLLIKSCPNAHLAGDLSPQDIRTCFAECEGDLDAMVEQLEVSRAALKRRVKELGLI